MGTEASNDPTAGGSVISLPSGGGAISGLGVSFTPDLATGAGRYNIPIAVPPGRLGVQPNLSLTYSTGGGSGPWGLGWHLTVPSVARKTSHGVPRYGTAEPDRPDIFVLGGAEDLVAVGDSRYRPRTEGLFARVEHVVGAAGDYWEVRTRDGVRTRYGTPRPPDAPADWRDPAVVADPHRPNRIAEWRVTESADPMGNLIRYAYLADGILPLPAAVSYADYGDPADPAFLVVIEFDYEERPDPISNHRYGFEVRTSRRCRTIRTTTRAADGVRRTACEYRIGYEQAPFNGVSLLTRFETVGIDGDTEEPAAPLTFGYTVFDPAARRFRPVTGPGLPTLPLDDPTVALADLRGVGLPDLVELGGAQRFWRNSGDGGFELPRALRDAPPVVLDPAHAQLMDADGDGRPDLVVLNGIPAGYFPMSGGWDQRAFRPYRSLPSVGLADPRSRPVDLDGDGLTDLLHSGVQLRSFFNDRDARRAWQRTAVSAPAGVDLSDPRIQLADMTGDGLTDIVLLRSGNISYWPNLGHGRFGAPVTMRNSPRFPADHDPRRLLLGDVDGDGVADLVFVDQGRILFWGNRSGQGWTAAPVIVPGTPDLVTTDVVQLSDLRGSGMAGLLYGRAADPARMRFLDLTGGVKPYLLSAIDNHRGATVAIHYGTSTGEFLRDQADPATRWRTTLPFPVHVVKRLETADAISGGRLVAELRYHHGFWDGLEREFRGFGLVEEFDAETFRSGEHFSPPTLTRHWFHLGTDLDLSDGYSPLDPPMLPPPPDFLAGLSRAERRDALRSMRGHPLRTEVYALDGTARENRPYTVTETRTNIRKEAPGVFFPFGDGERITQWERGDDPMTRITLPGGYDRYGLPGRDFTIAVPRGRDPRIADPAATAPYLATVALTEYAQRDDAAHYIVDRVATATSYEVVNDGRPSVAELNAAELDLRLLGRTRSYYDDLAIGVLGSFGLVTERETLAFTDSFLDSLGVRPPYLDPAQPPQWPAEYPPEFQDLAPSLAGYKHNAEGFWIVAARIAYNSRGLTVSAVDPLGAESRTEYDQHDLLAIRSVDAAGLATEASYDYRLLRPRETVNANGNSTAIEYSPLGMVTAQFARGKNGEGDRDLPGVRLTYDLLSFADRGTPVSVLTQRRVHHDSDPADTGDLLSSVEFSDGFGRPLQTRALAEDTVFGEPVFGGGLIPIEDMAPVGDTAGRTRAPGDPDNVLVSGWQVYDNKGRIVRRHEPFYSTGFSYAAPDETQLGTSAEIFYDPRGQVVRTIAPDGSEQRIVFGIPADLAEPDVYEPTPWETFSYDANDNAGRTHAPSTQSYATHWNTPSSAVVDPLGRAILTVTRNGAALADWFVTKKSYDIHGNVLTITDALGREAFHYVYDLLHRRWRMESMDAGCRDTVYDVIGSPLENRDAKGAVTMGAFDVLHRPIRFWARDSADEKVTLRQRVVYGDGGDPAQPPDERAFARTRNLLGRPARHYDEAGLVTAETVDFKGNVLSSRRRFLTDEHLLAAYTQAPANGWKVEPFRMEWTPVLGQSLADLEAALLEPAAYATDAEFDALNRATRTMLPSDVGGRRGEIRRTFTRAGEVDQVTLDGTVYVQRIAYDAKGQRVLIAYGNGLMTRLGYDPLTFRLRRMRTEHYTLDGTAYRPTGAPVQDCGYDHDLSGNILTIRDRTPGSGVIGNPAALGIADARLRSLVGAGDALDRRFEYDPLYRLVSATGRESAPPPVSDPWVDLPRGTDPTRTQSYIEHYTYDKAANLLTLEHGSVQGATRTFIMGTHNELAQMTTGTSPAVKYAVDANGNTTAETASRHFAWDHHDRLRTYATQIEGSEPSVHAQYLYSPSGDRVAKLVRRQGGAVEIVRYIDGLFEHHRWATGENNHIHVRDTTSRAALVLVGKPHPDDHGPAVAYHLGDHLNSSTVVVDGSGSVTNREEYTPYGETSFGSYARKRYRFTGVERDEESGLAYHGARYLMPWTARFLSCDPDSPVAGLNPYCYARGNPMALADPGGRQPQHIGDDVAAFERSVAALGEDVESAINQIGHLKQFVAEDTAAGGPVSGNIDKYLAALNKDVVDIQRRAAALAETGQGLGERVLTEAHQAGPRTGPAIAKAMEDSQRFLRETQRAADSCERVVDHWRGMRLPTEPGGGGFFSRVWRRVRGVGPSERSAGRGLRWVGNAAGTVLRKASEVFVAYYLIKHSFMAGVHLREGNFRKAGMEAVGLLEDVLPIPSPIPDHAGAPHLRPDQTIFKLRIDHQEVSGCSNCHDAVRVDYWLKTTAAGRMYVLLNGEGTHNGVPTDAAVRAFESNVFPLNPMRQQ